MIKKTGHLTKSRDTQRKYGTVPFKTGRLVSLYIYANANFTLTISTDLCHKALVEVNLALINLKHHNAKQY